jgi:hypothetical protein
MHRFYIYQYDYINYFIYRETVRVYINIIYIYIIYYYMYIYMIYITI